MSKKASAREEITTLRAERDELKATLRRLIPGFEKEPDAGWLAMNRLRRHLRELAWLSDPAKGAILNPDPVSSTKNIPIYPGVIVTKHGLRHVGSGFDRQLKRIVNAMNNLVDRSEDWIRGIDQETAELPRNRRPRCRHCRGELALTWRFCATCGRLAEVLLERAG